MTSVIVLAILKRLARRLDSQVKRRRALPISHDATQGIVRILDQIQICALDAIDVAASSRHHKWLHTRVDSAVQAAEGVAVSKEDVVLVISSGAESVLAGFGGTVEPAVHEGEVVGVDYDAAIGLLRPADCVRYTGEVGARIDLGEVGRGTKVLREESDVCD